MRVAGLVAYDGTDYRGFQRQAHVPTIQGELERAAQACTRQSLRVAGAGRTDAGVHASGQVIATDVQWRHSLPALQRAWNAHLPAGIVLRQLYPAPADFNPRFHALSRTYRYHALHPTARPSRTRRPLHARTRWYSPRYLDAEAMNQAAEALLLGTRDFAGFGSAPDGGCTVRTLMRARWEDEGALQDDGLAADDGVRRLTLTVTANAFLFRMVRRMVAVLAKVGRHEWGRNEIQRILAAADARACPAPAPAQGLVLCHVAYAAPLSELERS